jgi:hypothetical protein
VPGIIESSWFDLVLIGVLLVVCVVAAILLFTVA